MRFRHFLNHNMAVIEFWKTDSILFGSINRVMIYHMTIMFFVFVL